jgi:NADPH:quinone reductase-like Zn-dependent oxidoreductase
VHLVAEGALRPPIEVEAPWSEIATVAHTFYNRGIPGKAVLRL